jgi:hypothetical protein
MDLKKIEVNLRETRGRFRVMIKDLEKEKTRNYVKSDTNYFLLKIENPQWVSTIIFSAIKNQNTVLLK